MMNTQRGALYHWLIEPLTWIVTVIFQPARFRREFHVEGSWLERRILPFLRLVLPLFLVSYPITLLGRALLLPFHLFSHTDFLAFFAYSIVGIGIGIVIGIGIGIVIGFRDSIANSIANSIALGITIGIAFGIMVGITFDIPGSITYNIASGITIGITIGIVLGIMFSIALGIMLDIRFGIANSIALGIAFGIAFGIMIGIEGDIMVGIVVGIVVDITYTIGSFRLPFYLISGGSVLRAYLRSCNNPSQTLFYLQHSALHWDEQVYLPLPYLKKMLLMAYHEQPELTLDEVRYIATERPLQLRAAQAAILEIVIHDLEERKNIREIAEAKQFIDDMLPQEARLIDLRWVRSLVLMAEVSQDALQSLAPISLKSRSRALEHMVQTLRRVSPNVAFRDQRLNQRLKEVVEIWMTVAEQQRERLYHTAQEIGRIENPYKPGQVLQPSDSLFVGRRDLAEQLENELAKGSSRPTLLLNGERRMGKTSALLQLPSLLGSAYIPVFYNLQEPGICVSTSVLLSTIAQNIQTQLHKRGFLIKPFSFRGVQEYTQQTNHAYAYRLFGHWLRRVEELLEREEKTLLLAFDEFEKLGEAGQDEHFNLPLLLDWFRSIVQFHPRIALLFSGVSTLDEMGTKTGVNWSSYLINIQVLKVTFLKEPEAHRLITRPIPDYPSEELFGEGVVEKIMGETGRHPFLIQALCSALIDTLNVEKRQHAELADVDNAVEQILEQWVGYFSDLWTRTDEHQRECLIALNTLERADMNTIQDKSGLDNGRVRRTLHLLRKRDLVVVDKEGIYKIVAPIFEKWVESREDL